MKVTVVALILFLLVGGSTSFSQDKVVFVGGAPLDTYQPQTIVPLLEEAFRRNGILFEVRSYPSARSLVMSNSGAADGELHRVYDFHKVSKGKYPNLVRIESQLMAVYLAVFSKANGPVEDWSDLKGFDVAFQRGRQDVQNYLEENVDHAGILPKNSDMTSFKMLAEARVDYVVAESFQGQLMIKQSSEFEEIQEVGRLVETRIYAYMHKKHRKLAGKIATTLEAMKHDGTYNRIVNEVKERMLAGH